MPLDSDLLRTFLAVHDAGSFLGGSAAIYRSQSAASVQIRKLEELIGKPVFERHGRGVRLTVTGEKLEPVARKVVGQLDHAYSELTETGLSGQLRIGIPDDHGPKVLSRIIRNFAQAHPRVELSVHCSNSAGFEQALKSGALDAAVYEVDEILPRMEALKTEPMVWAVSASRGAQNLDPLSIALFDRDCWWRNIALNALQENNIAHRIVFTSESTSGVLAALQAGIAVGVVHGSSVNRDLTILTPEDGFPELPDSHLVLNYARQINPEQCAALADAVRNAYSADG